MRTGMLILTAGVFLAPITPARSNIFVESSFQQKMSDADVVLVGTVLSVQPGTPGQLDGTATVTPVVMVKGATQAAFVVHTQSGVPEEGVARACCQVGSTYVMFLRRTTDETYASVNGGFGLIRVGPAKNEPEIRVVPNSH